MNQFLSFKIRRNVCKCSNEMFTTKRRTRRQSRTEVGIITKAAKVSHTGDCSPAWVGYRMKERVRKNTLEGEHLFMRLSGDNSAALRRISLKRALIVRKPEPSAPLASCLTTHLLCTHSQPCPALSHEALTKPSKSQCHALVPQGLWVLAFNIAQPACLSGIIPCLGSSQLISEEDIELKELKAVGF